MEMSCAKGDQLLFFKVYDEMTRKTCIGLGQLEDATS